MSETLARRNMVEIAPHPIRGTKDVGSEHILLLPCEIRAAEGATDERPIIDITSSSGGEDRHGSAITTDAWRDEAFMRTGHVLWQHDIVPAYPFVGKKLSRRLVGDKLISRIELLVNVWRHMNCNLAAFLWEAFRDHGMGAMSRAFIPIRWRDRKATTIPGEFAENVEYYEVEQTEESFVNVPSNRDSFARAIERTRTAGAFNDSLARMLGYDASPIIVRSGGAPADSSRNLIRIKNSVPSSPGQGIRVTASQAIRVSSASHHLYDWDTLLPPASMRRSA